MRLKLGGSFSAISMSVMPIDQMSTLESWPRLSSVSGAIQKEEPITVVRMPESTAAAVPKSAIFTSPLLVSSRLPDYC